MAEETTPNPNAEEAPSNPTAGEAQTPTVSKEHAPSTSEPQATDLPTANAPDPKAANSETNPNAAESKAADKPPKAKPADKPAGAKKAAEKADGEEAPAKAAKKEKAPALEDKPFADFMHQDYLPALKNALTQQGIEDIDLSLQKQKIPVADVGATEECWQVVGHWGSGKRQFNVYFPKADINGPRAFSCADSSATPSTLEPFLIDERKITLDLLVFGIVQRLNAQKWLARN